MSPRKNWSSLVRWRASWLYCLLLLFATSAFLANILLVSTRIDIDTSLGFIPRPEEESHWRKRAQIIVIACNRPIGLLQTLDSVKDATNVDGLPLHICIDQCGNAEVERLAHEYHWPHGEKTLTIRKSKFGLAKHITTCWEDPRPDEWALILEDDVLVATHAFNAFYEGLRIRSGHRHAASIVGIALHDGRVNQYCWKQQVVRQDCQQIHSQCHTVNAADSILGTLLCMGERSAFSWRLQQFPSSWGAFYEGKAWSIFQQYFDSRSRLRVGESLVVAVPHSMSSEWSSSWKQIFMELMFSAGWTMMYRSNPDQVGFSTTMRRAGSHTSRDDAKEKEAKCLINLPLWNQSFSPEKVLIQHPIRIPSYTYCNAEISVEELGRESLAVTNLFQLYDEQQLRGNGEYQSRNELLRSISILNSARRGERLLPEKESSKISFNGEIVMVTSTGSWSREFEKATAQFEAFEGLVRFIVVAPSKVCQRLRGNIYAACLEESSFRRFNGNGLPQISEMLQAAADAALPGVTKWMGIMNGDILFDQTLIQSLATVSRSPVCNSDGRNSSCVLTGQRFDVDWTTQHKTMHSEWGMDYFIFNKAGLAHVLEKGFMPALTIGRVRWDSWLMGKMVTDDEMNVIDASFSMSVLHFMDMRDAFSSKKSRDTTNLELADERFRLGRTDFSNFRVSAGSDGTVAPLIPSNISKDFLKRSHARYEFDLELEKATRFNFTSCSLPKTHIPCFCNLLSTVSTKLETTSILGKFCSDHMSNTRDQGLAQSVFFRKEVFELINKINLGELDLTKSQLVIPFSFADNHCCVLASKTELPEVVPDRFWTHDRAGRHVQCMPTREAT